ncbi:acyl CoA ligase [Legionella wadsworthii]|uniref:Acyl CoA ligase n=1 Tax=Legionella wadsworthii TaxID=28088 RepID=A0A378LW38_9GAMM|nr:class I adenylate-forming enzyme family protein [Legionella wadsworthii]STY30195.1 acyl CoA ligase [Legionella wadsworthii]
MQFFSHDRKYKIALQFGDQCFSFADLETAVLKMELALKKLPSGILVLTAQPNSIFIIQLLAALNINKPVALMTVGDSEKSKRDILGRSMTVDDQGELLEMKEDHLIQHHPDLALVLFTSGSTGSMKAVQLSLKNIMANCNAVIQALEFSRIKDQLLFLPLSYSFGLLGQLLPGLCAGIKTHIMTQFTDIKNVLETSSIPQMWSGVPSHWVAIQKMAMLFPESAAKIRSIVSAGAPLNVSMRDRLMQTFPKAIIYNNYGLTEASPRVLTYSSQDPLFLTDFAGYPIGDWQVNLSKENELLIKGPQLMLGYLGEEQALTKDGWFYTGDLAEQLSSGLIAIKGRLDYIVNIAGEKINLIEIERTICDLQGMKEVLVIPLVDELYGIRLLACFEKNHFPSNTTEEMLTVQIKDYFLPKKLPIKAQLFDKLPRNPHGKLDRKTLVLTHKEE